ncbi:unnamed protein product [Discosporangium mesarthrocarpum]
MCWLLKQRGHFAVSYTSKPNAGAGRTHAGGGRNTPRVGLTAFASQVTRLPTDS